MPAEVGEPNLLARFFFAVGRAFEKPVEWFHDTVVIPNRKESVWYHRQYRRVPTIDECYAHDLVCEYEANEQYKLDKRVDERIVALLQRRYNDCVFENLTDKHEFCTEYFQKWHEASTAWFIKYGDLANWATAIHCYMKQKHRMVWERRYGPVGTGMVPLKDRKEKIDEKDYYKYEYEYVDH